MVARKKASKKTFTVELRRTLVEAVSIEVEAVDHDDAAEKALAVIEEGRDQYDWELSEDETEVTDIYPG